jgi:hypothetical protein
MKYLFYPWPDWIESFPAVLFFSPCSRLFLDLSPSPESLPTAGPSPPERPLQAGHHRSGRRRRARGRNVAACPPGPLDASCTRHVPRAHPLGRRLKAICPSPSMTDGDHLQAQSMALCYSTGHGWSQRTPPCHRTLNNLQPHSCESNLR